ncbi:MAG: DUF342 domain-containing protein [Betaproteobacteria bacterium]
MSDSVSGVNERESRNGEARVSVRPEGVFLIVTPPEGEGQPVTLAQAERLLAKKEIADVDWTAVLTALEARDGKPVLVAPRRPSLDRDATVQIEVSPDEMEAYAIIVPALGGRKLTTARVVEELQAAGVVEGIKRDVLEAAVAAQNAGGRFLVATGRPPVNGNDGYIDYRVSVKGPSAKPVELGDGRVDYYNLNTIQNVGANQVLAVRVAPTNGLPGVTVKGKVLPAKPGRDVRLPAGRNTVPGKNPDELVALVSGQVVVVGEKVHVLPVCEVRGDVDFSTGNIEFVGSVVIRGSVTSGFIIKAAGNVEVKGSVEAATIVAEEDIIIHRGVQGADRGRLVGKNIQARFIQNCRVEATGDVVVDEALMYADVEAQGRVETRGSKGRIVGGTVRAVKGVVARVIGSKLGTHTEIMVGVNPEVRAELERVTQELAQRERQLDEVVKSIRLIREAAAAGRQLPGGDGERLTRLLTAMNQLNKAVDTLRVRQEELRVLVSIATAGTVRALETVFPGVKITIGPLSLLVQDEVAKALFYVEGGEIRIGTA